MIEILATILFYTLIWNLVKNYRNNKNQKNVLSGDIKYKSDSKVVTENITINETESCEKKIQSNNSNSKHIEDNNKKVLNELNKLKRLKKESKLYKKSQNYSELKNSKGNNNGITKLHTKVVGVTYENRQEYINLLSKNQILNLVRQPDNKYDKNAIAVFDNDTQIGFIKKELAKKLAPLIDKEEKFQCKVACVTGQNKSNLGVNILIEKITFETNTKIDNKLYIKKMINELNINSAIDRNSPLWPGVFQSTKFKINKINWVFNRTFNEFTENSLTYFDNSILFLAKESVFKVINSHEDVDLVDIQTLKAVNVKTGEEKWSLNNFVNNVSNISDDIIIAIFSNNKIAAINASTGEKIWETIKDGSFICPPK
ncbi:MAG: HIRAN domain-containing protein, partial [Candidatus Woesearchaeota archaeon]